MILTPLKSEIHRAVVTQCDLNYEGSILIDADWLEHVGILPCEQVDVLSVNAGTRFRTYAITAPCDSRQIGINGATARLAQKDDPVIIIAYAQMSPDEAKAHRPKLDAMQCERYKKQSRACSSVG